MTTTINNEHKKLNVPNVRFPEFQGEWEKCKLRDIANITGGYAFKSDTLNSIGGKYQVVKMGNLYQNQLDLHRSPSYTDILTSKAENVILRKGDIAITLTGTNNKRDFGYTYIFNDEKNLLLNQRCGLIRTTGNPYFLSCLLKTYAFLNQFFESATGGTGNQANVSTKAMEMFSVNIPSLKEQKKIGELMALLDERIATQNKIIDKLQSLIKGLRVRLIQIENGNIVHLGEIAQIYQPQTISSTELTEDGFLVYGANGIIGKYKEYNHKTEQICITCRGNTCGMVNYTKPMSWITGNAMVINTDEHPNKVCKRYLYHYLSAYNFNSIISGSGQPQIVRTPLEKLEITLPSIFEQEQKAMLLDRIQAKIEISNRVLSLYQGQKQYLLRQMFI